MIETYPNPWNFDNTNKNLESVNGSYKVVYSELNEIGMGAPIGGMCFIELNKNRRINERQPLRYDNSWPGHLWYCFK